MKSREGGRLPWMCALVVRHKPREQGAILVQYKKLALPTELYALYGVVVRRAARAIYYPVFSPQPPFGAGRKSTSLDSQMRKTDSSGSRYCGGRLWNISDCVSGAAVGQLFRGPLPALSPPWLVWNFTLTAGSRSPCQGPQERRPTYRAARARQCSPSQRGG